MNNLKFYFKISFRKNVKRVRAIPGSFVIVKKKATGTSIKQMLSRVNLLYFISSQSLIQIKF